MAGRNKHKWTLEQDSALVDALVDLHNKGTHNADNGFRSGYLKIIEDALKIKLPDADLRIKPHIMSRLKTMKSDFSIVHDMIYGTNTSGFGWDSENQIVTAEPSVWEAYLESHPKAKPFRNKRLPHFESLQQIFGKDRARGNNAVMPDDISNGNNEDEQLEDDEVDTPLMDETLAEQTDASFSYGQASIGKDNGPSNSGSNKSRKRRRTQGMEDAIREAATSLGEHLEKACQELNKAEAHLINQRESFLNELMTLGLDAHQIFAVGPKLGADEAALAMYFAVPIEHRAAFVLDYLSRL